MPASYIADTNKQGAIINYCPFGCERDQLDDYGHCRHLIGHSDDQKTYEPIAPLIRKGIEGPFDTGMKVVTPGKATALKLKPRIEIPQSTANNKVKLENPTGTQRLTADEMGQGYKETYFKWQSWRVYQQHPAKELEPVGAK